MAHHYNCEELAEMKQAFVLFDKDGSGAISVSELKDVLKAMGKDCSDAEAQDMIRQHDTDGNMSIDFEEFCEMMHAKLLRKQDEFLHFFKMFDKDGSGKITRDELQSVMKQLGENLSDADLDKMIAEADADGDGQIDYEEFVQMMMCQYK